MFLSETNDSQQENPTPLKKKRAYFSPTIEDFGTIRAVTLGGSPGGGDMASGGDFDTEDQP